MPEGVDVGSGVLETCVGVDVGVLATWVGVDVGVDAAADVGVGEAAAFTNTGACICGG
jgi:hypothetical protein